jgi:hypothetical protein
VANLLRETEALRVTAWMGSFGGNFPKPLVLTGTAEWIDGLRTGRPVGLRSLVRRNGHRVTGTRHLAASAAYPQEFADAVSACLVAGLADELGPDHFAGEVEDLEAPGTPPGLVRPGQGARDRSRSRGR